MVQLITYSLIKACANVRVQLDSQPEEIDTLERKRMQLEVELHALEKETDYTVKKELNDLRVKKSVDTMSEDQPFSGWFLTTL
ncbi:putative clpA/ClpB, AAA lid domain-containing protein [Helianthus anomalus]